MPTIEADVTINQNREVTLKLPPEVQPGNYRITLVIQDKQPARPKFDFSAYQTGIVNPQANFSRQELYDARW